MITGMLGFGLLGAAASTFVRDQLKPGSGDRKPDQPLVKDLPGVIIRGGSAAIVVFLGVMGGLAIFSVNDNPRPNAYVLLFTCLAGAVFSERVWDWADDRLREQFGRKAQNDGVEERPAHREVERLHDPRNPEQHEGTSEGERP
jgi:hypothetical protein